MAKSNKADLSLQMIAIAILVLVVLGIIIYITQSQLSARSKDYSKVGESAGKGAEELIEKIKSGEIAEQQNAQQPPQQTTP